ncbi:aminotransferase class I/II-fold pyridoxal phosphate-dependent enzyme [Marivirga arenosa]|uniref:Pyridoxal phosphate-dependent aminotransferase family protein n=1 Tax=Marivirga arenosa TaxID=3059076 RepID=A0AA51ZXV1_9BACT|nr:pyridoxal phosphate-dependent aminotransferase family protein [Marivirga sp. BKB1-2]WNB18780.1 pyridoxal phosphate-dependent aminotransferase family protein [Marivirga sp. BKB1-2]
MKVEDVLESQLQKRKQNGSFRTLKIADPKQIDFSSNDYLGLAQVSEIHQPIEEFVENGASGSRLLNGNKQYHEDLESFLAEFFKGESSLIFNSGYVANLGVLSSIPQKGDVVLIDELSHVCIKEGVRLSRAQHFSFKHNDLSDLEQKLNKFHKQGGNIFIVVESVYSMDGDESPLLEIVELANRYDAYIIVDEAHSTALHGDSGFGYCCQLGIQDKIFARIYTFGKAVGAHGAAVVGSKILREYLINYSRQFIYTTALPYSNVKTIEAALNYRQNHPELWDKLQKNISLYHEILNQDISKLNSNHPIQGVIFKNNNDAIQFSNYLNENGFNVRPILSPTVVKGKERVRICLHAFNSEDEVRNLCHHINQYFK